MSKIIRAVAAFVVAAALCCGVFAGCASNESSKAQFAKDFVGVWQIQNIEEENGKLGVSQESLDLVQAMGGDIALELKEDGTGELMLTFEGNQTTWSASQQGKGSIAIIREDGSKIDMSMTLEDGALRIGSKKDGTMVFAKVEGEAADKAKSAAKGEALAELDNVEISDEMNVVLTDNDNCKIVVRGKGKDLADNAGYELKVTNRTDKSIVAFVSGVDEFKANDSADVEVFLSIDVRPGRVANGFMHFAKDGKPLSSIDSASGVLCVQNEDGEELGAYPFNLE